MQRRRVRSNPRGAWRAGPARFERCGCVRARWAQREVFLFSCKQGAAPRREQRACAPSVPVLEMPLMSPQAVVAVAAAESPVGR